MRRLSLEEHASRDRKSIAGRITDSTISSMLFAVLTSKSLDYIMRSAAVQNTFRVNTRLQ
jgi:hypothetical protein